MDKEFLNVPIFSSLETPSENNPPPTSSSKGVLKFEESPSLFVLKILFYIEFIQS